MMTNEELRERVTALEDTVDSLLALVKDLAETSSIVPGEDYTDILNRYVAHTTGSVRRNQQEIQKSISDRYSTTK